VAWSGIDCAGLVQAIHSALISPSAAAWNISTAVLPGFSGTEGTPHSAATSARCWGWPGRGARDSRLARPPTSRPPIALGWPVSENGPAPGLPICAGGQVQVDQRGVLAVPLVDWFRPWQ
jgi:hypothetical protein